MFVSQKAAIARINRHLAHRGETLKKSRSVRMWMNVGDYYVLDRDRNWITQHHVNVEELARELGVLERSEQIVDEVDVTAEA